MDIYLMGRHSATLAQAIFESRHLLRIMVSLLRVILRCWRVAALSATMVAAMPLRTAPRLKRDELVDALIAFSAKSPESHRRVADHVLCKVKVEFLRCLVKNEATEKGLMELAHEARSLTKAQLVDAFCRLDQPQVCSSPASEALVPINSIAQHPGKWVRRLKKRAAKARALPYFVTFS